MIENLKKENILTDYGQSNLKDIKFLENSQLIKLPANYINFILLHNGATLIKDIFDYNDPNSVNGRNADGIVFNCIEEIPHIIETLKLDEDPDWDDMYKFEDGLIPFGDNGGGDMICFDYRKDRTIDDPPIVIWNHDMGLEHRIVFIANNFEEFINMLHKCEDI